MERLTGAVLQLDGKENLRIQLYRSVTIDDVSLCLKKNVEDRILDVHTRMLKCWRLIYLT